MPPDDPNDGASTRSWKEWRSAIFVPDRWSVRHKLTYEWVEPPAAYRAQSSACGKGVTGNWGIYFEQTSTFVFEAVVGEKVKKLQLGVAGSYGTSSTKGVYSGIEKVLPDTACKMFLLIFLVERVTCFEITSPYLCHSGRHVCKERYTRNISVAVCEQDCATVNDGAVPGK